MQQRRSGPRSLIALPILLVAGGCSGAAESTSATPPIGAPVPSVSPSTALEPAVHLEWDDAKWREAIERAGRVTYRSRDHGRDGLTIFTFAWRGTWTHTWEWRTEGASIRVAVHPRVKFGSSVEHLVELPFSGNGPPATSRLLLHELDHVAISTDERPYLLFRTLAEGLVRFERTVPAGTVVDAALVNRFVNEEIDARKRWVEDLLRTQYALLDEKSAHGLQPLPDRRAFFERLFEREGLADAGFPGLAAVEACLADPAYVAARRWYAP